MKIGTRIVAGYVLALIVVGAVGVVAYRSLAELIDTADWVTHTHLVKETLAGTLSAVQDAETGQRGFVLTGEERYLAPYTDALRTVDADIARIKDLTPDNPRQQERLNNLRPLVTGKLAELAETIALRRQRGEKAAVDVVLTDRGKNLMDDIRRVVAQMDEEESSLLRERDAKAKSTAQFASSSLITGGLVALVLVSIVGVLIQRSITGPLSSFMQFVGHVGEGDLTRQAKISSGD
ncbi:MAG TPA: CHASE3 domain-containing protein, partial [Bryobacteraceae bacterium]|nr:CHASE3 domain-containing protein [Bryobacteraceae bacterium]